ERCDAVHMCATRPYKVVIARWGTLGVTASWRCAKMHISAYEHATRVRVRRRKRFYARCDARAAGSGPHRVCNFSFWVITIEDKASSRPRIATLWWDPTFAPLPSPAASKTASDAIAVHSNSLVK